MKKEWTIEELDKMIELCNRERKVLNNEIELIEREHSTEHKDQEEMFVKERVLEEVKEEIKRLKKEKGIIRTKSRKRECRKG